MTNERRGHKYAAVRGAVVRAVYCFALPFGVMQRDLAGLYRRCLGMNPLWLPVNALLVPVVLILWAFNRLAFTALYRGMVLIAGQDA
jgi:hypothetical protein